MYLMFPRDHRHKSKHRIRERQPSCIKKRANDGTRTRDTWLGKPVLYQLSYIRFSSRNGN